MFGGNRFRSSRSSARLLDVIGMLHAQFTCKYMWDLKFETLMSFGTTELVCC